MRLRPAHSAVFEVSGVYKGDGIHGGCHPDPLPGAEVDDTARAYGEPQIGQLARQGLDGPGNRVTVVIGNQMEKIL
jgi:hypothetical protein